MGKKLVEYYDYIETQMGRDGKVKLAQMTCVPSVLANGKPDDPKTLETFREAIKKLTGKPAPP